eukprot:SM000105S13899  [mRNA]  locus=s105:311789:314567:+ [translate_table: standard]
MSMTVAEFVDYWEALNVVRAAEASCAEPDGGGGDGDVSGGAGGRSACGANEQLLYLKDWHFVKEYPEYGAYETPPWFAEDWLNWYLDWHALRAGAASGEARDAQAPRDSDDYRFVYMGPRGTWTPVHADVLASFSWSVNICGRKRWLLLPADQTHLLRDRPATSSQPSLPPTVLYLPLGTGGTLCTTSPMRTWRLTFRGFMSLTGAGEGAGAAGWCQAQWLECVQEAGEALFVPSGWHHQVVNLEDTISINHNWINGCNIDWTWRLLQQDYDEARAAIVDIRDIADDFEALCQRNLAMNTGLNYSDFWEFLRAVATEQARLLVALRQQFGGWQSCQLSGLLVAGALPAGSEERCPDAFGLDQAVFGLQRLQLVLADMACCDGLIAAHGAREALTCSDMTFMSCQSPFALERAICHELRAVCIPAGASVR